MRALLKRFRSDRSGDSRDSGLSMAELLVASMMTVIVMVMVGQMFLQTTTLTTQVSQARTANGNAMNISNEITSVVRVATNLAKLNSATPDPAVVAGGASSLTIYSLSNTSPTNPAPVKITFTLDTTGKVTETRCTGNVSGNYYTFGSCVSTTTRTLGDSVLQPSVPQVSGAPDQLFSYLDLGGHPLVIGSSGSLDAGQRAVVGSIIVTVRTRAATATTSPIIVSNTVVLRNIGLDTGS